MSHLNRTVETLEREGVLGKGEHRFEFSWQPPAQAPRGYGVDLRLEAEAGIVLRLSTAFDVLEHWTQAPRYGFLTDFTPERSDADETLRLLARYHINALQFYDWMYRHDQLLTDQEPYLDPLGRLLSRRTVEALITAAHRRRMVALPYTAVYGASIDFYRQHPDWALLDSSGKPCFFFDFLAIMDPRPGSPWTAHLIDQFDQVLAQTAFDGIHLDQYGDPKAGYDSRHEMFDLAGPLAELINTTKACVRARRAEGTVIFNAVGNWPIAAVAPADQDLVYIEFWPPDVRYADLHRLIVEAQALGSGKAVICAAYIDPACEANVRLIDAIIFASGGSHIELGERSGGTKPGYPGMLADPYFPKYQPMSPRLAESVRRLYDFSVRYQEVVGPRTRDASQALGGPVHIAGISTDPGTLKDKIWPILRRGEYGLAISLINLLGLESSEWKHPVSAPPSAMSRLRVELPVQRSPARLWWASPDGEDISPQILPFREEGGAISFEIPSLEIWDLIVLEWDEESQFRLEM